MAERIAIVGIGQTHHQSTRGDVSVAGLVREAAQRALDDAQYEWSDIDAVVIGKAPDFFEGVMMPELYLAEALGAVGKPMFRVHTAGSVGGSTAIVASDLIKSGIHRKVLTVAFEKQSESEAMWALSLPIPFQPPMHAGAGGYFAPHIRAYMQRSGAPDHIGILVVVKDRTNALKNPYAHLHDESISFESVRDSMMLWDPIRYSETCPSSDGACAMVLTDEAGGDAAAAPAGLGARHGHAQRADHVRRARHRCRPRAARTAPPTCSARPASPIPAGRSTWWRCTCPSAGSSRCGSRTWASPAEGEGWKMVEDGATQMTGDLPVNCSGGVLSSNPIGASGMLRFAEAAMQVRGQAGEHQIDGARTALGHAYGGGSQFFSMWVVGADKP